MRNSSAIVAELVGTFFLCFAGIAAILGTTDAVGSGAGLVGIALAHGLALSVAVNAFAGVSGAHFNPAVTVAALAIGRITPAKAAFYVVAQLAGALAAATLCRLIFPPEAVTAANLGIPLPAPWVTPGVLFLVEFILTFMLIIAIIGTAIDTRGAAMKIGGFGIGLTVTFNILAAGPVTGASMNPARSFGPAFVQGYFDHHLLYWLAPIAGAVVGALVYQYLILDREHMLQPRA